MTLYDMLEVMAKRSRTTLRKLIPSALLFCSILVIWGTFTAKKIKLQSKIRWRTTISQMTLKGRKQRMSHKYTIINFVGDLSGEVYDNWKHLYMTPFTIENTLNWQNPLQPLQTIPEKFNPLWGSLCAENIWT